MKQNIAIFGLGCIGSVLAKQLHTNTAFNTLYFNRSDKDKIRILYNKQPVSFPIQLTKEKDIILDWLIVCLKEYHYTDAISQIKTLVSPNTKVAVFRNGLDLASHFLPFTPAENILETIIDAPTQKNNTGEYIQLALPKITLPVTPLANTFIPLFKDSEVQFIKTNSLKKDQWEKLIESSSLGSIQCLYRKPCSVFEDKTILSEYLELINEAIAVAQSDGVIVQENFSNTLLEKLTTYPPSKGSSMLSDILAGKQVELDAKIGAVLKVGLRNGVNVGKTQEVYDSISKMHTLK